jgi:hypothetical protein
MTTAAIIYAGLAAIPFVLAASRYYDSSGVIRQTAAAIKCRHLRMPLARMPANENRRTWA